MRSRKPTQVFSAIDATSFRQRLLEEKFVSLGVDQEKAGCVACVMIEYKEAPFMARWAYAMQETKLEPEKLQQAFATCGID